MDTETPLKVTKVIITPLNHGFDVGHQKLYYQLKTPIITLKRAQSKKHIKQQT